MEDKYLLNAKTSDGYYVETSLLVMSTTLGATFSLTVNENGVTLCGSTPDSKIRMEIKIKNLEYFQVDPTIIGTQYDITCTEKNIIIMNNKKKDSVNFCILRQSPETLNLIIKDSINMTTMSIDYDLHLIETDIPLKRPIDRKLENPTVVADNGELTKSFKILTKSCTYAEIQSQKEGLRIIPKPLMATMSNIKPIELGKWNDDLPVDNTVTVKMSMFKSSNKLLTLSKKIRLYCTPNGFYLSMFMVNGLGRVVAQYLHTEPVAEEPVVPAKPTKKNTSTVTKPTKKEDKRTTTTKNKK